jgi:cell division protease FtsH
MAAAREGAIVLTPGHLDRMRDKLMMGSVRTLAIQPEEHRRLAVTRPGTRRSRTSCRTPIRSTR